MSTPRIQHINSADDPRIAPFCRLTEAQLRNRLNPAESIFIAESPKVIRVALDAGYQPVSLLAEQRHLHGDAADIVARYPDINIYTGERGVLENITGYTLTRGVLMAMRRPQPRTLADVCSAARRVVVIDNVVDTTNIGSIFRSAAALGIDAVLLTPTSCDPLNRRSIRVSMGSVFLVPWTWLDSSTDYIASLKALGFSTVAMALTDQSIRLDDPALHTPGNRLAIIMGNEGDGLPPSTIAQADYTVMIPMAHSVDSLNVGAASAIAFYALRCS